MTFAFDLKARLVLVRATVRGPEGDVECRLALDTGASGTQIDHATLRAAGYGVAGLAQTHRMNTVGGVVTAGSVTVDSLSCLGQRRARLRVVCHTLPAATRVDGLLGLDFFRGQVLTLDFARGRIIRRPPRPWWRVWG